MVFSEAPCSLLIKCKALEACHLVATAVLSSVTCVIGFPPEFLDSPPVRCGW